MSQSARPPAAFEVWMYLPEENRQRLVRILDELGVSWRKIAKVAGHESHTYMQRLLRGEVRTLGVKPAHRIEAFLHQEPGSFFKVKASTGSGSPSNPRGNGAAA